jgi:hypothetical protein
MGEPSAPFLAKGDLVLLEGLTTRPDLNGRLVLANGKQRVRASDGAQQVSVTLLYKVDPLDGQKPFWAPWSACCAPIPDPDALALISNRVVKPEDYVQAMRRFQQHQTNTRLANSFVDRLMPQRASAGTTANESQRREQVREFRRCLLQALVPRGGWLRELAKLGARVELPCGDVHARPRFKLAFGEATPCYERFGAVELSVNCTSLNTIELAPLHYLGGALFCADEPLAEHPMIRERGDSIVQFRFRGGDESDHYVILRWINVFAFYPDEPPRTPVECEPAAPKEDECGLPYPRDDATDEEVQAYLDAKLTLRERRNERERVCDARERFRRQAGDIVAQIRPHYCIFCGKEEQMAVKCCGTYVGTLTYGPSNPLMRGTTFMGRQLCFSSWPWQGDPDAPYVRIAVGAED